MRYLLLIGMLIILAASVQADLYINECGVLDQAGQRYFVSKDLEAPGTCFSITGEGISLDLDGHTINYGTTTVGAGIIVGAKDVSVYDGTIIQGGMVSSDSPAMKVTAGENQEFHHLVILTKAYGSTGIWVEGPSWDTSIHHVYMEIYADQYGAPGNGADCIFIDTRGPGGLEIHDNIFVNCHRGINLNWIGYFNKTPTPSNVNWNLIQHSRRKGLDNPYGIQASSSMKIQISNNQIISDDGRGISVDGIGQHTTFKSRQCNIRDNRVDVQYSKIEIAEQTTDRDVFGIADRYRSGENTFERNTVLVENDARGLNFGFYVGSDEPDDLMERIFIRDNTVIARDEGVSVRNTTAFQWDYADSVSATNNRYRTDGEVQAQFGDVDTLTFERNTKLPVTLGKPSAPKGLRITKFLDSYVLRWDENPEDNVYEYIVYRDGRRLQISPRGGTFFVDTKVKDLPVYQISALNVNGEEGPNSTRISAADAAVGWEGNPTSREAPVPVKCGDADADCDGTVDKKDLALLAENFGKSDSKLDMTGDGVVGLADLIKIGANFGKVY